MVPLRKIFIVALSSAFLSAKISVNGSREPRPTSASVDLHAETVNSISIGNSSEILPPNTTLSRDSRTVGCPGNSKTCLSLCCPPENAQLDGHCVEDNTTARALPRIRTSDVEDDVPVEDFDLFTVDPCAVDWMVSSVLTEFDVLPNGMISVRDIDGESFFDFEHHCLFRKPRSAVYLAKVCRPWIKRVYWQIICWIFIILVLLVIIIGHSVVPELKNLHGMVFCSYLATYIGTHVCMIGQQLTADSRTYAHVFTFFVFSLHYTAGACALWLNVMSFNIWRTFRGLRVMDSNNKERDRRKYTLYAIYAWVTPAVLYTTTALVMSLVPYFHKFSLNKSLILWICAGLLITVVVFNTFLYSSTALRIRRHQRDTAHLTNGVNKHHEVENQWFNLYVKLFMIMGSHTIMWVIWELWPTPITTCVMLAEEVIQSILIFVIFFWKRNVRRSLRQQFNDTLCRLHSTFHTSHATPTTRY